MRRMAKKWFSRLRILGRLTEGSAAVEFAIIGTAFIFLLGGIVDLSHAWYMRSVMANASREGARYGTRYYIYPTTQQRILPKDVIPSVQDYILNTSAANGGKGGWGLLQFMPSDANTQVTLSGAAATETVAGNLFNSSGIAEDLTVTITARKTWFLLCIIPGMGSYTDLSVTTTMKCE